MAENPRRPLLNPVLRFTKDPKPEGVSGGGKNAGSLMRTVCLNNGACWPGSFARLRRKRRSGRASMAAWCSTLPCSTTPLRRATRRHDLFQPTRARS